MKRSTRTFLVLLGLAVLLAAVVVAVSRPGGGSHRPGRGSVLAIDLEGSWPEVDMDRAFAAFLGRQRLTFGELVEAVDRAASDERIVALELGVGYLDLGWGRARELRDALLRFAASGKPIHAFIEDGGDDGTYYLASTAESIRMMPSATLWLDGINAEVTFYGGTLAKVGVQADLEQIGAYKNAADVMKRTNMSDEHREAMDSLVGGLFDEFVADVAATRDRSQDEVRSLVSGGPYAASKAVVAGLVDATSYRDEAEAALDERLGREDVPRIELDDYAATRPTPRTRTTIGLVHCVGDIMPGESADGFLSGAVMGSDTVAAAIDEAVEDDGVDALVLRVDSPGGSPVASDVIWRAVERAQDRGVPVVVSMADVAASGGYWISMGADRIFAEPSTITGSIGIFGGKYVVADLNDKIAMATEPVRRGENAGINSSLLPFTPAQRDWLRSELGEVYGQFLAKTAEGRGFASVADVDAVARGRVWTGRQALEHGLVDELGGLSDAIAAAGRLAGGEGPFGTRRYPRSRGLFETLAASGVRAPIAALRRDVARDVLASAPLDSGVLAFLALARQLEREGILAYMPYRIRAR